YKSGTSLLHLQLMGTSVILSLLFVIFSTPSLIQGRWLIGNETVLSASTSLPDFNSTWDQPFLNTTSSLDITSNLTQNGYYWTDIQDTGDNYQNFSTQTPVFPIYENYTANYSILVTNGEFRCLQPDVLCQIYGFLLIMLHTIAVWVVVGLHCDKYCAIATPLRYNQLVTRRRIAAFSVLAWLLGLGLAFPPLICPYAYTFAGGACIPTWYRVEACAYTWTFAALCIVLPFIIILVVNGRIIIIARHHQHRIFSAIFEVMMSAQATVTHQKNPFDVPKKKRKSVWTVLEQIVAFVICYYPFLGTIVWESLLNRHADQYLVLLGIALLMIAPLVNSILYGIKCKNIRKAFKNYLRKKLYKTEVKHEIQARIPSASNSRRPSISSTLAMPILQKSLQRRMSDYLLQDQANQPKLLRRSSDMSWHPLEDGTPSPTRLRKPLDAKGLGIESSPAGSHSPASCDTNFLTVPTFEMARSYCLDQQRVRLSVSSLDSDTFSVKESYTEYDFLTTTSSPDNPSQNVPMTDGQYKSFPPSQTLNQNEKILMNRSKSIELLLPVTKYQGSSASDSQHSYCTENKGHPDSQTPLLCKSFQMPQRRASLNSSSSPYILRTLEAILSVRISQNLLRNGSGWGGSLGSIERLSKFLRESRQCTFSNDAHSYCPVSLYPESTNHYLSGQETNDSNPEESDTSVVLNSLSALPNGGPNLSSFIKDKVRNRETSLAIK
ncbi:hypothetical protein SK128_019915, partial [Halocaridina rubra]